jgi:hypothetical protein
LTYASLSCEYSFQKEFNMYGIREHAKSIWGESLDLESAKEEYINCENCGRPTKNILHVPVFDYLGCEDCHAEAMRELDRRGQLVAPQHEARKPMVMAAAGLTLHEYRIFEKETA